jgi:hypothetical protein
MNAHRIVIAMAVALVCVSCAPGPYKGVGPRVEGDVLELSETLVLMDKKLIDDLAITNQKAEWTADARLKVYALIKSRYPKTLRLQVQTVFKDVDGFATGDQTNWELVLLGPHETYHYSCTAMNTKAQKYVIRVRYAR